MPMPLLLPGVGLVALSVETTVWADVPLGKEIVPELWPSKVRVDVTPPPKLMAPPGLAMVAEVARLQMTLIETLSRLPLTWPACSVPWSMLGKPEKEQLVGTGGTETVRKEVPG